MRKLTKNSAAKAATAMGITISTSILIVLVLMTNGVITFSHSNSPFSLINDMDKQVKVKFQSADDISSSMVGLIKPSAKSIPSNLDKYKLDQTEYQLAEKGISKPKTTNSTMLKAKNNYDNYCVYCHDANGHGNGSIVTKVKLNKGEEGFPKPADLTSSETRKKSDARLFHILSAGQNLMMPVSHKLSETERWELVHYIRSLQQK
jgi:mono/diheme cytochrome c family protein/antitoxin component of RelBE/YafQ-DinJ toxin-antitoxin module